MKKITVLIGIIFLAISFQSFANDTRVVKFNNLVDNIQDTIEFTMYWDFKGDCDNDCYKFIGTGYISKINGKFIGENYDHIFVKCPSNFVLNQSKTYKFIAIPFTPNYCSTKFDTLSSWNTYYLLVTEIK